MAVADFDGLYYGTKVTAPIHAWKVGSVFKLLWPMRPVVHASGAQDPLPSPLCNGIVLRKPFAMARLIKVIETATTAAWATRELA